jgi:hypothetical protein
MIRAEDQHRDHAVIEQVFADCHDGPLAHLPSGKFAANAAWLTCAAIARNLLRAAGTLASRAYGKARGATIRRDLINLAARTAGTATATSPSTSRQAGTARPNGSPCSPPPAAPRQQRPDPPRPGQHPPRPQRPPAPRPRTSNPDKPQEQSAAGNPRPGPAPQRAN